MKFLGIKSSRYHCLTILAFSLIEIIFQSPSTQWRGQVLPLVHLRQFFTHPRLAALPSDNVNQAVVTVGWGRLKAGLIVDKLIGKQEIVIKSLGPFIGNVPGLSGCTILGNGHVALIVDVPGLVSACLQTQRHEGTT